MVKGRVLAQSLGLLGPGDMLIYPDCSRNVCDMEIFMKCYLLTYLLTYLLALGAESFLRS